MISQPRIPIKIHKDGISYYKEKQFELLGIFSRKPYLSTAHGEPRYFNVGEVWFWHLSEQIVNQGITMNK